MMAPGPELDAARGVVDQAASDAGRDPLGMEGRVSFRGDVDAVIDGVAAWADAGATHLSINTMGAGLATVDDHLAVLSDIAANR
jgi:alkanesulfonate monooxygenase SsuD/methylene tetrahydromethanopterin reductase-like flavin-dependent oxidoreductase (luciferase family)